MPLRDDLLAPIPGDNPGGADLRYDPIYDRIKEARREEADVPQGEWQHTRKVADWPLVIKLTGEAIATKSKDLQLAVWLAEAMLRREGMGGFRASLEMIRAFLVAFWDHLYPEIEDGDLELRAAPLDWIGARLDVAVRSVPLNKAGHDYFRYMEARAMGSESEAESDSSKQEKRAEAVAAGKPTFEDFEKSFGDTPKPFYKTLAGDVDGVLAALAALDETAKEKFGDAAPSFIRLRDTLAEEQRVVKALLTKKLELDPDPVAAVAPEAEAGAEGAASGEAGAGTLAAEPTDRRDATARVVSAARFLRHSEPRSPVSYLMLRALRWGELRADGSTPDPKLLEAPTASQRTQLRGLMLDSNWEQLLESAETVMGTPVGRGWLDLQRYALMSCQALGEDYAIVAAAVRSELRALLAAIPALPAMSLMDDLPAASGATLQWLQEEQLTGGEAETPPEASLVAPEAREREGRGAADRAGAEVRAGRPEKAVELLMRALDKEKTRRGRFLRQAELARVMVDAGFVQVAQPILQEMLGDVENHKLEEWEAGDLVARPMALLYRCLEKTDGDAGTRQELYLRICRLDPLQAIGFGPQG